MTPPFHGGSTGSNPVGGTQHGNVEHAGKSKALWRSWLARRPVTAEVAGSSPVRVAITARHFGQRPTAFRPGSSVGTSVRLKSGRSPVRSRPWPLREPTGVGGFFCFWSMLLGSPMCTCDALASLFLRRLSKVTHLVSRRPNLRRPLCAPAPLKPIRQPPVECSGAQVLTAAAASSTVVGKIGLDVPLRGRNVLHRGSSEAVAGIGVRVALKGDGTGGWYVLTGFPTP